MNPKSTIEPAADTALFLSGPAVITLDIDPPHLVDEDWGVAILDHDGWRVVTDGLPRSTAETYAAATAACGSPAIAVRRFQ